MRIHAIHVQGLLRPPGVYRAELEPGYSLFVAPDPRDCGGLRTVIEALLFPVSRGAGLDRWLDREGDPGPRAGIALTLGSSSLRVISDLASGRVHLGRFEPASRSYRRVSTDPAEIEAELSRAGLPDPEALFEERALGWAEPEPEDAEPEPEPAERDPALEQESARLAAELDRAEAARDMLRELERRATRLRAGRERFLELRGHAEAAPAGPDLSRWEEVADRIDGLEARVQRYRGLVEVRDREREVIQRSRQTLIDERTRLRKVAPAQRPWVWLGVVLAAAGTGAAEFVEPWLGVFALVGVGIALTALGMAESARRRLRGLDTRLAALRVRERGTDREFESDSSDVRSLLLALDLDSPDELVAEARRYRELAEVGATRRDRLSDARGVFPEEAEAELNELEERIAAMREGVAPELIQARLAELERGHARDVAPEPRPEAETCPEFDLDTAARRSGRSPDELLALLEPVLPLYLRTLTGGFLRQARYAPEKGWRLRDENGAEVSLGDGLPPVVPIAFHCALIEVLAPADKATLFVGPGLDALEARSRAAVSRAFQRLSALLQVVQLTTDEGPWGRRAEGIVYLGGAA